MTLVLQRLFPSNLLDFSLLAPDLDLLVHGPFLEVFHETLHFNAARSILMQLKLKLLIVLRELFKILEHVLVVLS
jgi:hypothetical protein